MEQKELSDIKRLVELAAQEQNCSVLDLAAAFMQMHLGDVPKDIEEEKPYFERKKLGRRGKGFGGDRDGRSEKGSRAGRNERFGRSAKSERSERFGRTGKGEKAEKYARTGKGERFDKAARNSRAERDAKSARDKIGRGFLSKKKV